MAIANLMSFDEHEEILALRHKYAGVFTMFLCPDSILNPAVHIANVANQKISMGYVIYFGITGNLEFRIRKHSQNRKYGNTGYCMTLVWCMGT